MDLCAGYAARGKGTCALEELAHVSDLGGGVGARCLCPRHDCATRARRAAGRPDDHRHTGPDVFTRPQTVIPDGVARADSDAHRDLISYRNLIPYRYGIPHSDAEFNPHRNAYGYRHEHTDRRSDSRWGCTRAAGADPHVSLYIGASRWR